MRTLTTIAPGMHTGLLVLCAAFLAGCGSSNSSVPTGPTNTVTGATTQSSSTASVPITVPATGGTIQTVTVGSTSVAAVVPSGASTTIAAGTPLAVVQSGSTLLGGAFTAGTPVAINGVSNSGVTVDATGRIAQNVALPIDATQGTDYAIALPQGDIKGRALTIRKTTFSGRFYKRGSGIVSPLPTGVTGKIHNNGENAVGSLVTATFGDGNNGRTVRLTVDYGNGFVLDQTQTISAGKVTFQNFATDTSNIPAGGISTLALAVGP